MAGVRVVVGEQDLEGDVDALVSEDDVVSGQLAGVRTRTAARTSSFSRISLTRVSSSRMSW